MPVSDQKATEMVKFKRAGLLEVLTLYGFYSRKNTFFDYIFLQIDQEDLLKK